MHYVLLGYFRYRARWKGRLTLDSPISAGGSNISVGQCQILALARAIVRGGKFIILDEATSAIDYKTDAIIQTSLRNELGGGHGRRQIMVLDTGCLDEFDRLLKNDKGMPRVLVDEW